MLKNTDTEKMLLTIFTPTFNRGNLLERLYKSLCDQQLQNFEWVIVDDGSSDNTEHFVEAFKNENRIPINYHKQINSGKHIAVNTGALMAKGELFFIVDSDDYLTSDSTFKITDKYKLIQNNPDFAGLSGRKGYSETEFIGSQNITGDLYANALEFRYTHRMKGDMAEIIRTDILKKYPFPVIANERFCTEATVWYKVALDYKFLWFDDIIYIAEYLEGGLTSNSIKVRKESPEYSLLFYSGLSKMPVPFAEKLKAVINFWRFSRYSKRSFGEKFRMVNAVLSLIALPISFLFFFKDK